MKTPKHLTGLVGVLMAVEEATKGTSYEWLVRADTNGGYFANIGDGVTSHAHHDRTPTGALSRSLMEFNLRTKGNKP
jgi:hypothetical protein